LGTWLASRQTGPGKAKNRRPQTTKQILRAGLREREGSQSARGSRTKSRKSKKSFIPYDRACALTPYLAVPDSYPTPLSSIQAAFSLHALDLDERNGSRLPVDSVFLLGPQ